jgi:ParB family chromosome partitioning protein
MTKVHIVPGATSEWGTPAYIVEAAREVMGSIDFDPASSVLFNKTVKADKYLTRGDDGLSTTWYGRVWMNPPYSDYKGQANEWLSRLHSQWTLGMITSGMTIFQVGTLSQPGAQLLIKSGMACIFNHRVKFVSLSGVPQKSPPQSNVVVGVGINSERFRNAFRDMGVIVR